LGNVAGMMKLEKEVAWALFHDQGTLDGERRVK